MLRVIIALWFLMLSLIVAGVGFTALLDGRYLLSIACALYAGIAFFICYIFVESLHG